MHVLPTCAVKPLMHSSSKVQRVGVPLNSGSLHHEKEQCERGPILNVHTYQPSKMGLFACQRLWSDGTDSPGLVYNACIEGNLIL